MYIVEYHIEHNVLQYRNHTLQLSCVIQQSLMVCGHWSLTMWLTQTETQHCLALLEWLFTCHHQKKQERKGKGQLCQRQSIFCHAWAPQGSEVNKYMDPEFSEAGPEDVGELGKQLTFRDPLRYLWVFILQMNAVRQKYNVDIQNKIFLWPH